MMAESSVINFSQIFLTHCLSSLDASFKRINEIDSLIDERIRTQALYVLTVGLKLEQKAWPETRKLLIAISAKIRHSKNLSDWIPYLKQGIGLSERLGDDEAKGVLQLELGMLYRQIGEYDLAEIFLNSALVCLRYVGNQKEEFRCLNAFAYLKYLMGDYVDATKLANTVQEFSSKDSSEYVYCCYVLGAIAFDRLDWEQAKEYFQHMLTRDQVNELEHLNLTALGYRGLGNVLHKEGELELAISNYQKALEVFNQISDSINCAATEMNLGSMYLEQDKPLKAVKFYALAESTFDIVGDKRHLAMLYTNKGIAYRKLKQWEQAEDACRKSIKFWTMLNHTFLCINAMNELGLLYTEQGKYNLAIGIFHEALNLLEQLEDHPKCSELSKTTWKHLENIEKYR